MSNCLTQARFVQKDSSISPITVSTDGHFTFWNLTPVLEPFYTIAPSGLSVKQPIETTASTPTIISCESRYQIHSNSIKSLELAHISDTTSLIVAGGDDNALTVSLLNASIAHSESSTHVNTVTIPDAHTASVTTVKLIEQRQPQVNADGNATVDLTVASSGNDHRVKIWSVRVEDAEKAISVGNVVNQYSPVADISSLDVIRDAASAELKLLVCGVGMEMLKIRQ